MLARAVSRCVPPPLTDADTIMLEESENVPVEAAAG